jgi:hypothetical protein
MLRGSPARLPEEVRSSRSGIHTSSSLSLAGWGIGVGSRAPGLCSIGESVTFQRRFQLQNALSFHGLCSPPRSSSVRRGVESPLRTVIPCG